MDARTFSSLAAKHYAGPPAKLALNLRAAGLRVGHLKGPEADRERERTLDVWLSDWERRGLLRKAT